MKKWYVVHTQTGSEDKVKLALDSKIAASSMQEFFSQVVIPTEQISEVRSGKKKISLRKFFPGYVLIEMDFNEKTWLLVKTTPGVTGFIGSGNKPSALTSEEVDNILKRTQDAQTKPTPKVSFETGEPVRVIDGPFVNFNGVIEEVHLDKQKIEVSVSIFGRSTPVELEYWQVEKI
ncbi:MAG: transcription termination/antitermination protein NusG [Candidatus Omnitrophica bacterium]|nr:transcription termination/antitermination protein NusG [Candidatus Omnitrophota bacterium]MDD5352189.1 transcription termination/antitermination protein NusG [Candidatus Omnitrophota bacterium]MDD5549787.1 transcription termination/antitermination protein NusG [Candidatus Omnitrophota bacterium]